MRVLDIITVVILSITLLFFLPQIFYTLLIFFRRKTPAATKQHSFAYIICAKDECAVVGRLLDSIKKQNYDAERIRVFLIADNCTDGTADIARGMGATVFERTNTQKLGKGYALDEGIRTILNGHADGVDGFLFLDADNVLHADFTARMNDMFETGAEVFMGFRNIKNFGDSWVSACGGIMYFRENRFVNRPRRLLHAATYVSGTGFCVAAPTLKKLDGWPFHSLIEDIEFSVYCAVKGIKIDYCEDAVIYDEQPVKYAQSAKQRMRWSKGTQDVFKMYWYKLLGGAFFKGKFACFEMFVHTSPLTWFPFMWTFLYALVRAVVGVCSFNSPALALFFGLIPLSAPLPLGAVALIDVGLALAALYAIVTLYAYMVVLVEWKVIKARPARKLTAPLMYIVYMAGFILFMLKALFKKNVVWYKTDHTKNIDISELEK